MSAMLDGNTGGDTEVSASNGATDDATGDAANELVDELEPDTPVFAVKQRSKYITLAMLVSKVSSSVALR